MTLVAVAVYAIWVICPLVMLTRCLASDPLWPVAAKAKAK